MKIRVIQDRDTGMILSWDDVLDHLDTVRQAKLVDDALRKGEAVDLKNGRVLIWRQDLEEDQTLNFAGVPTRIRYRFGRLDFILEISQPGRIWRMTTRHPDFWIQRWKAGKRQEFWVEEV